MMNSKNYYLSLINQNVKSLLITLTFLFLSNTGFAATKTWAATSGAGDWFTAANWSPSGVPSNTDDVVIAAVNGVTATVPCLCSTTSGNANCKNLTIDISASIYVWNNGANNLYVWGNLVINGIYSSFQNPTSNSLSMYFNPLLVGGTSVTPCTITVGATGDASKGEIQIGYSGGAGYYNLATNAKFHGFLLIYGNFKMNGFNLTTWQFLCSHLYGLNANGTFFVGAGKLKICGTSQHSIIVSIAPDTWCIWNNAQGGTVEYDATGTEWTGSHVSQFAAATFNYVGNQVVYPVAYNKLIIKTISPYTVSLGDASNTILAVGGDLEITNPSTAGGITATNVGTQNVTVAGNIYLGATSLTNPSGNALTLNCIHRIYRSATIGAIIMGNNASHNINISYLDALASSDECFTGFGTPTFYGTVSYNGNGNQEIIPATFYNITLAGTSGTKTALGNNSVTHNWTNNRAASTNGFAGGSNTVSFIGSSNQIIGGTATVTSFNNLTINNTFGGITLSSCYDDVISTLTLTSGIIYSGTTAGIAPYIRIKNGASVSPAGGSASSYVDGYVRKTGFIAATQFNFPTGNGTYWRRIGANIQTTSTTDEFEARYIRSAYSNTTSMAIAPTPVLSNVSNLEYWMLTRTSGAANATVTLFWEDATASVISSCGAPTTGDLCVSRYNGSAWENWNTAGGSVTGSCLGTSSGSISSQNYVTSFSPFTFGSKTHTNILPIELLKFNAECKNGKVDITWATASEKNNNYFTIERTIDGSDFENIGTVSASGNSSKVLNYLFVDHNPETAIFYYRLRQTDYDGTSVISDLVAVRCDEENTLSFSLSPNPAKNELTIAFQDLRDITTIVVTDLIGQVVISKEISISSETKLNIEQLSKGVYFVSFPSIEIKPIKFIKQ